MAETSTSLFSLPRVNTSYFPIVPSSVPKVSLSYTQAVTDAPFTALMGVIVDGRQPERHPVSPRCRVRSQVGFSNRWRLPESVGSDLLGYAQAIKSIHTPYNRSLTDLITAECPKFSTNWDLSQPYVFRQINDRPFTQPHIGSLQHRASQDCHVSRPQIASAPPNVHCQSKLTSLWRNTPKTAPQTPPKDVFLYHSKKSKNFVGPGSLQINTTTPVISSTQDACTSEIFGSYTDKHKQFIYCHGMSYNEREISLYKYVNGKLQSIVYVSRYWKFRWFDHDLKARTTLMKIEDRNPGVLLRFDQPQCEDNAVYRCQVKEFYHPKSLIQTRQKNFTVYTGDFTTKVSVDQPLSNANEVQSGNTPLYAVKTKVLIHLTCTAHVATLPASIEWHRYRKSPPSAILWDKNDFGESGKSVSGCDYTVSNQLPYYVIDEDIGEVDFVCTVQSNGVKNSMRVSFTVQGPIVTTTPAPTIIVHQIHEANGIRVTVTPLQPIIHQNMTIRCDDIQVRTSTLYFIRLSKTNSTGSKTIAVVERHGARNVNGDTRVMARGSLLPNPFLEITLEDVQITDGGSYRCSVGELLASRFIDTVVTLST